MKFLTLLALFSLATQAGLTDESRAFIELRLDDELTTITAKFTNAAAQPVTYAYLMSVTKTGKNGEMSSAQGGEFTAEAGKTVTLSSNAVNFSPTDAVELKLEILDADDRVLYEDRLARAPEK